MVIEPSPQIAATNMAAGRTGRSVFVTAPDGLRLHVREYGAPSMSTVPVVCLPGLARTTADFDALAPALAFGEPPRRVIAIDSRGRGQSEYDPDPQHYNLAVELSDVLAVLTALQVGPAVFVGSSRGGILTMLLAAAHPAMIAGAVLHDIGPMIEPTGLIRIKNYIGKLARPGSFGEGAEILRQLFAPHFPKLTPEQWLAAAQRTWKTEDGALVPTYDVQLAHTLADLDIERLPPPLWNEFDALARAPVLVIRGANSDILSAAAVDAMRGRHPALESIEVPDQGHVPLLDDPDLINRIGDFVRRCDRRSTGNTNVVRS
jgi:pimeloyl-ACP methyl ester carboxylesterase